MCTYIPRPADCILHCSERGTTKKASARDTKKSPRGMNKKACSTKEDIPNYYEEKHHEPAADGMANVTTSDTKTLRAPVIKVQKMVTKKGINCHTRQKQRKATCSPGVGGKKCSVPLIPAGDGGSGVQPVGKMMTTKDESQDSSSSPAASSPTPLAAVSSQEGEASTVCSTDAMTTLFHLRAFVYVDFTPLTLWNKSVEYRSDAVVCSEHVPQDGFKVACLSQGYR